MSTLTIRNLEPAIKTRLRVSAAIHGRSMEEEARVILGQALQAQEEKIGMGSKILQRRRAIFAEDEAAELLLPERREMPRSVEFEP
ncbi:plasmid stabilization protein [Massilia sp. W12]|uniref:FitA-like ribbon-helix-helix domain-containing protein n=1 Tax=Massilia sp. W12 TaxID=3126507 RepID=UPI0030D1B711